MKTMAFGMATLVILTSGAAAGNLKYQPTNPSFGGNPLNSSHLLGTANAQNSFAAEENARLRSGVTGRTPAQEFADTFQRRLLLSVSDQITDSIFGENARDSGEFDIGGTTIRFQRIGNDVRLVINDGVNETTVVVPVAF